MLVGLCVCTLSARSHWVSSVSYSCGLISWMKNILEPGDICDERWSFSGFSSWLMTGRSFFKWRELKLGTLVWKLFAASWNNIWLHFRMCWQVFAVPWNQFRLHWEEDWAAAVRTVHRILSSHKRMPNILLCIERRMSEWNECLELKTKTKTKQQLSKYNK